MASVSTSIEKQSGLRIMWAKATASTSVAASLSAICNDEGVLDRAKSRPDTGRTSSRADGDPACSARDRNSRPSTPGSESISVRKTEEPLTDTTREL
jgi:hypothetical protein